MFSLEWEVVVDEARAYESIANRCSVWLLRVSSDNEERKVGLFCFDLVQRPEGVQFRAEVWVLRIKDLGTPFCLTKKAVFKTK